MVDPASDSSRAEKGIRALVRYLVFLALALAWPATVGCACACVGFAAEWRQALEEIRKEPEVLAQNIADVEGAAARYLANPVGPDTPEQVRAAVAREIRKAKARSAETLDRLAEKKSKARSTFFKLVIATVVLASVAIDGSRFYRSWNRRPKAETEPGGTLPE